MKKSYQEHAAYFDALARDGIWEDFPPEEEAGIQALMRLWDIRPGHRVLEPGCGAGRLTRRLAQAVGAQGKVVACDIAREMTARARGRKYAANVSIHCCPLLECPPENGGFDRIICFNVFPHFDERERTLRHLHDLLTPEGRLWICHNKGRSTINGIHADGGTEIQSHKLPPVSELADLLESAGLTLLESLDTDAQYYISAQPSPRL